MSSLGRVSYFFSWPLKVLLAVVLYQPLVLALPQGGQVTQGSATIQQVSETKLNINQSTDRAVINWNSFSIAPQEWVNFQQPSSTSATLNRVTGSTPSSIAGRLTANGQVFLVNPNGIAFLPTAQVDVAGLVASTLNIKDSDFMQGTLRFEQVPGKPPASVVNQGFITVKEAGFAALVAPAVQNSGVISARLGKVVLASGTTVSLDFYGDGLLSVTVDPKLAGEITDIYGNKLTSLIDNQGNITAPGGVVVLTAQAAGQVVNNVINTGGIIEARYAEQRDGVIILSGGSKGTVAVNGTLDVSGEKGGKVQITGENVGLFGTAKIDASGDKAGGLILVGGDYLGGRADKQRIDPSLNAQNTFVSSQSILSADAKISGNGGEVIIWADNFTRFDGKITATGDNGGFVETSGKNILEIGDTARVDTTGRMGNTGTWLLDPLDLKISGTGTNNNVTGSSPFQPIGTGSLLRDTTINTALAASNVVVKTVGTVGSDRGDIIFTNNADVNWATKNTFTVQAAGQILMESGTKVTSTNTGSFNAVIFEANKLGSTTGNFNGIELQNNAKISTKGGSVQLTGVGGNTSGNAGVLISGANTSITTQGTGTITITGTGKGTAGYGIVQKDGAQVTTANGTITYNGKGAGTAEGIRTELGNNIIGGNSNKSVVLTSLANGITLNDVKIQTKENIIITSPGNVSQNNNGGLFATTAGKGLQLNGAGNYTLTNPNNDIDTLAVNNTGNLSYRDANGFVVGTVGTVNGITTATTKNVSLEAGGAVTQTQKIVTGGLELKGAGAIYTLINTANDVITLAATTNNDLKFTDANGLVIGAVGSTNGITATGKNVFLTVNAVTVTQTKAIQASGLALQGGATFTLTDATNDTATFAVNNTGNVSYRDANGFVVGSVGTVNGITTATTKNVSLEAGGAVTQTQKIVTGGLELKGAGAIYTLTNANNDVVTLAATTNNDLSFTDKNAFAIGTVGATNGITATGKNVTLTAGGAVTQTQAITSSGLELKGAGAIYTLTNANNDVVTLAANVGNPLSFTDKNTLTIGTVNTTNGITTSNDNVTIETGGLLTLDKATVIGTGTLSIKSAGVTQNAGGQITGTNLRLLGTGTFNLNNTVNNIALLAADVNGALTYVDTDVMSISAVSGTNGVKSNNNPINISTVNGNLTIVNTTAVNDVDAGTSTVSLTAGGNNIFTNSTNAKISGTGGVTITADRMTLNAGSVINSGTAITTLQPNNAGRLIDLGGADVAATTLGLTAVELNTVTSGTLRVGKNNSGNITVSTAITPGGTNTLSLITDGTVSQNAGATITETKLAIKAGDNVTLTQNNQVNQLASQVAGSLKFTDLGGLDITNVDGINGIQVTGDTTLNNTGTVTQTQAITTNGLELLGSGAFVLTNAGNDISTLAGNTTNDIKYTDANGFTIGSVNSTNGVNVSSGKNLTLTASDTVNQTQAITANGLELLGSGEFTLTNPNNNISILAGNTSNSIKYTDTNGFDIGTVNSTNGVNVGGNNLTLTAGGTVTQSKTITADGLELLGTGAFNLTDATNNIKVLAANTTNSIKYTDSNAFIVGIVNSTTGINTTNNNLTLKSNSTTDSITFAENVNVGTGNLSVESGTIDQTGGSITVNGIANFTSTKANTGNVTVNNNTATLLDNSLIGGDFTLTSTGNVTQAGSLKVAGTTTITAPNGLSGLTDPGNILPNVFSPTTGDLIITGVGTVDLPTKTITGNLTVTANATGTGFASIFSGDAIKLNQANNFGGTVSFNTQTATLVPLSGTPKITQSGIQTVGGTSTFNAVTGTIDLNLSNQLTGAVTLNTGITGGNINLNNNQATAISSAITGADLTITANGNLTQTGAITTGGTTTLNVGANDIILNNAMNDFNTLLLTANNAQITDKNALVLSTSNITNNLTVTTNGNLTQIGAVTAGGTTTLNVGAIKDILLNNPANDFNVLNLTANNAKLTDANGFIVSSATITNTLNLTAGGAVTQSGAITAKGLALQGSGSYTLGNLNNDIQTLAANTTSSVIYTDKNSFTVATVDGVNGITTKGEITLEALNQGDIIVNKNIINTDLTNSPINLTADRKIQVNLGVVIDNQSKGAITLEAKGNDTDNFVGIELNGSTIQANGGNIQLTGKGGNIGSNNHGIHQYNGSQVTTSGNINYFGQGGNSNNNNHGIFLEGANTKVTTQQGNISFDGTGNGTGKNNNGIIQIGGAQVGTNISGDITYTGKGGNGTDNNFGILIANTGTKVTTKNNGNIKLSGKGQGTGQNNFGIIQSDGAEVSTAINGDIKYTGTGGNGTDNNFGILITDAGTKVTTKTGVINLTGTGNGTGNGNIGISQNNAQVSTTNGNINYIGQAGNGQNNNHGIFIQGSSAQTTTQQGNISFEGTGNGTGKNNNGIIQIGGAQVGTNINGDITYTGKGGNGTDNNFGILIANTGTKVTTNNGNIKLSGKGQGTGQNNFGIIQSDGAEVSTAINGDIKYTGIGGNGKDNNFGILIANTGTKVTTKNNGNIKLSGKGQGTGQNNFGIIQSNGAEVSTAINGDIKYTGTGGNGTDNNFGILITDAGTKVTTKTGVINLQGTGQGSGNNNFGILQANSAEVSSIGGAIDYKGTAANNADAIRTENGLNLIGKGTTGTITLTAITNGITLNDAKVQTTNNIIITSPGNVTQNSNGGVFSDGLQLNGAGKYTLTNPNNDVNILAANTSNVIEYTDASGFKIGTVITDGINTPGNVILKAGNTVNQSKAIIADGLALLGNGEFDLQNPGNSIKTIAANTTNNISFVNSKTLIVGKVSPTGITTTGTVFLQTLSGDIILDESVQSTATKTAITLVAEDNFINNVGKGALSAPNGRWLVYATSPAGNVKGWPVLGGSQQFNTTYPQPALFAGNGFLYKVGAPPVPLPPNLFNETTTFTFNFNERQWRDFATFPEQSALVESLICTNDPSLATSEPSPDNEIVIIPNAGTELPLLGQRVFFVNDGLPQCDVNRQALE